MCRRSANNRFIHFLEVTAECEKLGQLYGPPTQPAQSGRQHGGCPLAEVWITAMDSSGSSDGGDITVASAYTYVEAHEFFFTKAAISRALRT